MSEIVKLHIAERDDAPISSLLSKVLEAIDSGELNYKRGLIILWREDVDSYTVSLYRAGLNEPVALGALELAKATLIREQSR